MTDFHLVFSTVLICGMIVALGFGLYAAGKDAGVASAHASEVAIPHRVLFGKCCLLEHAPHLDQHWGIYRYGQGGDWVYFTHAADAREYFEMIEAGKVPLPVVVGEGQ